MPAFEDIKPCKAPRKTQYKDIESLYDDDIANAVETKFKNEIKIYGGIVELKEVVAYSNAPYYRHIETIQIITTDGTTRWINLMGVNCCHLNPMNCDTEDMSGE